MLASLLAVAQEPLPESADKLLERACDWSGTPKPIVSQSGRLAVSRRRVELPSTATTMTVMHVAAHLSTPSVFPPHGAEFCDRLLKLTERFTPWTWALLQQEFALRGVHHTAEHRQRAVLKAVLQRSVDGTEEVEAVVDDPPGHVVGGPVSYDKVRQTVYVGNVAVELRRLRYLAKIR